MALEPSALGRSCEQETCSASRPLHLPYGATGRPVQIIPVDKTHPRGMSFTLGINHRLPAELSRPPHWGPCAPPEPFCRGAGTQNPAPAWCSAPPHTA